MILIISIVMLAVIAFFIAWRIKKSMGNCGVLIGGIIRDNDEEDKPNED